MSSVQRRRGQEVAFWPETVTHDMRGNRIVFVDMDAEPTRVRAAVVPNRANRAEVPGQQEVDVYDAIVDPDIPGMGLWARAFWRGSYWDVASPPAYHHGSPHVRHVTVTMRRRPDMGGPRGDA